MRGLIRLVILIMLLAPGLDLQAQRPCRMSTSDLIPIIDRFNPFFTDHTWENSTKTETARMDPHRLLVINQKGCIRHHVMLSLIIDPAVIKDNDRFWISEMLVMLKRIYFDEPGYLEYKKYFEKEFVRAFLNHGTNKTFTFPINDRSFICKVEYGRWGAKVKLESVRFILNRKVRRPGIKREKDDGWYKGSGSP